MSEGAGPVLCSARLVLTPCTREDVDALHALWTDPQVRRFLWDDAVIPRALAEQVVESSIESFASCRFGLWTVSPRGAGRLAGFCMLRRTPDAPDPELLYGLAPGFWRRGYAVEASAAALEYAFTALALPAVIAGTDTPNERSLRVIERLGFWYVRDTVRDGRPERWYALDRETHRARRAPPPTA